MSLEIGDCSSLYKEIEGLKKEDVDNLLKWCKLQPFLPRITEMHIIHFLHSNNFSNEAAKRCIDLFYTARTHCPELFTKRNPNEMDLDVVTVFPFGEKSPEGYRIMMSHLIDNNPDKFNFTETLKMMEMVISLILNKEGPTEGIVYISDLTGVSFSHLTKMNLLLLRKFMFFAQECSPVKIKGIHYINTGNVIDKIITLIRPFMKKELFDILYIHPTMDSIYKMIPKEYFPKDYPGGLAPCIAEQFRAQKESLLKNVQFFQEEDKQVINERLRPGKPKNAGDIFGIEGTFKKLDID